MTGGLSLAWISKVHFRSTHGYLCQWPLSSTKSARGSSAEGLRVLDPELRRSLTKLTCDIDLGTAEDLDVVNPKLIARDELEILRMRKQKKQQRERDARAAGHAAGEHVKMADDDSESVNDELL